MPQLFLLKGFDKYLICKHSFSSSYIRHIDNIPCAYVLKGIVCAVSGVLKLPKNNMRRCLFLWGSTVKCSITNKSPFLAQSFKFAHLPTKKAMTAMLYLSCFLLFYYHAANQLSAICVIPLYQSTSLFVAFANLFELSKKRWICFGSGI